MCGVGGVQPAQGRGKKQSGPLAERSGLATGPCFHQGSRVLLEADERPVFIQHRANRPSEPSAEPKFSFFPFKGHPT